MGRPKLRWNVGAMIAAALLSPAGMALAADQPKAVTFSKDVAPILQAKCQSCHEPGSIAPMSLRTYQGSAAMGEVDQVSASRRARCRRGTSTERRHSEVQERHVAHRRAGRRRSSPGSIRARSKAIRPTCRRRKPVDDKLYWQAERDGYGPPDLVVKSPEYTMPAVSQDQWWRPMVDMPGLTEPRWVRMVEIRPTNIQGRKILHHSIAHIVHERADPDSVNRGIASGRRAARPDDPRICQRAADADGMGDRQRLRPLP